MAEVVLEHLSKTYPGGVCAVQDVSLTVSSGEFLVLVGPSGCGKTTALRLIAGLETPSNGLVRIGGRPVNAVPPWQRDVALAFQRPALYPHLNVRANLAFGLTLQRSWLQRLFRRAHPVSQAEINRRVVEAAGLLDLEAELNRYPGQLSGGQQQRVALGRALVRRPAVLLLDEPFSGLDSRQRAELRRQLHLLRRQLPATMIYVTHDPVEALALGDRVAVLNGGIRQQVDTPLEVYRRPANRFVAGFLGWPPASFLDGRLVRAGDRLCFVGADVLLPLPAEWASSVEGTDRPVTLGIRPEDVQLGMRESAGGGEPPEGVVSLPVEMIVTLVEFQGPSSLVTCSRGGWQVACTASDAASNLPSVGQTVMVRFRLGNANLFDTVTGKALACGRAPG